MAVASRDHVLAAADEEVTTGDLDDEQLVRRPQRLGATAAQLDWPQMSEQEAIERRRRHRRGRRTHVGRAAPPAQGRRDPRGHRPRAHHDRAGLARGPGRRRHPGVRRRHQGTVARTPRAESAQPATGYRSHMRIVITGASGNVGSALSDGWPTTAGTSSSGSSGAHPRARDRSPRWSGWPSTSLTTRTPERCAPPARAPTPSCTSPGASSPRTGRPTCGALGVGGTERVIDAVVAAGVPHLVHMSSVGAYSPKRDDAPSTRRGRPAAYRRRCTAGTRPPPNGSSTRWRSTPPT